MPETKDNLRLSVDKHRISQYSAGLIYPPAVFTQSALRSRVHDNDSFLCRLLAQVSLHASEMAVALGAVALIRTNTTTKVLILWNQNGGGIRTCSWLLELQLHIKPLKFREVPQATEMHPNKFLQYLKIGN